MITAGSAGGVYAVLHKVDFRKSHDGLLGECYKLGLNPFEGDVVMFVGRCRRKIKTVYADSNGLWVSYKRFNKEAIKTKFTFLNDPCCSEISTAELAMFLEGHAYRIEKRMKK